MATFFSTSFWDFNPNGDGSHVSTWVWLYWILTAVLTISVLGFWQVFPKLKEAKEQEVSIWQLVLESLQQHLVIIKFWRREKVKDEEALSRSSNEHVDTENESKRPKRESRWRHLKHKGWLHKDRIRDKTEEGLTVIEANNMNVAGSGVQQARSEPQQTHTSFNSHLSYNRHSDPDDDEDDGSNGERLQNDYDESDDANADQSAETTMVAQQSPEMTISENMSVMQLSGYAPNCNPSIVPHCEIQQGHPIWTGM